MNGYAGRVPARRSRGLSLALRAGAFTVALIVALGVLAVDASEAWAQEDEPGAGERACDALGAAVPGGGLGCNLARGAVDSGGGDEDEGSADGSSAEGSGSGEDGSGGGSTGTGEEGQGDAGSGEGKYGIWTKPINLLQGLIFIAAGVGIGGAILLKSTAGGNRDRHELAIHMFEGSLAGFVVGTFAVQFYNFISSLVVGF